MRRPRKVTMKPSRKGQALLPLATRAVAARPNSPNARQPLAHSKKWKGSKVNGHIASLGLYSVQILLHTGHSMGPLETISNRQDRQGLPSDGEQFV